MPIQSCKQRESELHEKTKLGHPNTTLVRRVPSVQLIDDLIEHSLSD